MMFLMKDHQEK